MFRNVPFVCLIFAHSNGYFVLCEWYTSCNSENKYFVDKFEIVHFNFSPDTPDFSPTFAHRPQHFPNETTSCFIIKLYVLPIQNSTVYQSLCSHRNCGFYAAMVHFICQAYEDCAVNFTVEYSSLAKLQSIESLIIFLAMSSTNNHFGIKVQFISRFTI
jgi:hypothetical protein